MYDCLNGVNTNICKIVALFFADDGIIMMHVTTRSKRKHTSTDRHIAEVWTQYKQKKKQHTDIQ